jgi:hypothetical protein
MCHLATSTLKMDNLLNSHRTWICDLIVRTLAGQTMPLSPIEQQHIKLLIRWYPQITQHGKDFYPSYMKSKRGNASKKARKELASCQNIRFSREAFKELKNKPKPDLYPEHNPSVKQIYEIVLSVPNLTVERLSDIFTSQKYEVIMLTKAESNKIQAKHRISGCALTRLRAAFEIDNCDEFIVSKKEIEKYLDDAI